MGLFLIRLKSWQIHNRALPLKMAPKYCQSIVVVVVVVVGVAVVVVVVVVAVVDVVDRCD